ncbi:MAG TPA: M20/M25/M40 family metallo-hydrolase [Anaeromyxobacteraceae bacterium]|nr:M20/M25/M40 family metallo-hydrolase [Anaeromyxobacteraceae bacterium]
MLRAPAGLAAALLLAACARAPAHPASQDGFDPARAGAAVSWLADPARTGRGVGTPGGEAAAEWLEARMREIGLAPGGEQGYQQPFEAPVEAALRPGNALEVGGTSPALSRDWQPFTFSDDGSAEGELVWAGYGITAPDLGHDDYAGLDVKGKIVLVAQDFPREQDERSPFRDPRQYRYGEWRYKAMNARDHGAAAILGVRDDWNHPGADDLPPWRGTVSSRAGLIAARATLAALRAAGVDAAALAAASADGRPHPRALGVPARLAVAIEHRRAPTSNVIGIVPGADPALAGECVVVGAHYDHLGLGGEGSLSPEKTGTVHPGADDNASGTAAMLEIARAFAAGPRPRRTVVLVAFGAEELGLLGSARFVKAPPAGCPPDRMALMVNLDMVGRPQRGKVYVEGASTAKGLREDVIAEAARAPAIPLAVAFGGDGYGPSDQTSFYAVGVPVLFFFTGAHADYHRPSDTPDKIDAAGLVEVARLAYRAARGAADRPARYEVVRTAAPAERPGMRERERGYGAYLGAIPDFGERSEPGVLLTGVRSGSPAERAGLGAGDVLVRVGAARVQNLQDLAYALRAHRPGDVVEVEWRRSGEARSAKVTLEERK